MRQAGSAAAIIGFFLLGCAGCSGSLSSTASATDTPSTSVTATAQTSPISSKVAWTAAPLTSGQQLIEYKIYRDGSIIDVITSSSTTTYTDSTTASSKTLTYATISNNGALATTNASATVSPVTAGASHYYTVTYLYVDNSTGIAQYFETSLGTSNTITLASSS